MNQSVAISRRYPEVAQELRELMIAEAVQVGDKLPTERSLAERLSVGRALLREALIMLEIQGYVEVRQGSGIYVLRLPNTTATKTLNDIGPFELLQARQVIESAVAEAAALTVTKNDIDALQSMLNEQSEENQRGKTDYKNDEAFHLRIAAATQNSVLAMMVESLWAQRRRSSMWQHLHLRITNQTYWQRWLQDHQQVLNALKRKDPVAAGHAMWQHLENVRETVFLLSDVEAPEFDGYLFKSLPLHRY